MQHVSLPVTMLYELLTSSIKIPHHLKEHQAQRVDSSWIVPGQTADRISGTALSQALSEV